MSSSPAKVSKPSWRSKPFLSIRARLIVLAVLAIIPLVFQRIHSLQVAREHRIDSARAEVMDLAERGIASQRDVMYSVRALLQLVATVYARTPFEPSDCNQYLVALAHNVPWIGGLSIAQPEGQIVCSTEPNAIGLNVSDRPHFQKALQSRGFALSDYLINRTHQVPTLVASYPAIRSDGAISAVVLSMINLQWINELVGAAARRSGASVVLLDGGGTLIAASADSENLIGKNYARRDLAKAMLSRDEGAITTAGFDGIRRITSYARVPWTNARLAVGLDERAVQSGIDREVSIAYLQLALFAAFVLLVAWFGGEQLVVRPIRSLVRTAARFGRGDLHVRATQETWIAEFEPLAVALDDMAHKLAVREEELRIANEHLEELASLDGLTGLANRRGFDRQLEQEWQRAMVERTPLALMMIDIDHFKLYNDRYGHVAGDTCLRSVGETLSLVTLEAAVLVARYGGEEFALLLPRLDLQQVTSLAEEARHAVEELLIAHAEAPCGHVTISIGVDAIIPEIGQMPAELVEAADGALYTAKRRGRNRVVAYTRAISSAADEQHLPAYARRTQAPLVA